MNRRELFMGAAGTAVAAVVPAPKPDRAAEAMAYFKARGFSDAQAAGIVAGINAESQWQSVSDNRIRPEHARKFMVFAFVPLQQETTINIA